MDSFKVLGEHIWNPFPKIKQFLFNHISGALKCQNYLFAASTCLFNKLGISESFKQLKADVQSQTKQNKTKKKKTTTTKKKHQTSKPNYQTLLLQTIADCSESCHALIPP